MRKFRINRDIETGHRAGEFVADIRLPREAIPRLLEDKSIEEIDPNSVKFLVPAPSAAPLASHEQPRVAPGGATAPRGAVTRLLGTPPATLPESPKK
jgi:hypothetical protein